MARWMQPRNLALVLALGVPLLLALGVLRPAADGQAESSDTRTAATDWNQAGPSCQASAVGAGGRRLSLAELTQRLAARGTGDTEQEIVVLNGNGYNYGGDPVRLEHARLLFEASQGSR